MRRGKVEDQCLTFELNVSCAGIAASLVTIKLLLQAQDATDDRHYSSRAYSMQSLEMMQLL